MKKMDRILKECILVIIVALLLVGVLNNTVWPMRVKGNSMENTFYNNALVIVCKFNKASMSYNKGDIIVAKIDNLDNDEKLVKRIIGVEGDHIVITNGVVMINGEELQEPYVSSITTGEVDLFVPRNGYFLLGDNRSESKDSRALGCVFRKDIIGKIIYIVKKGN